MAHSLELAVARRIYRRLLSAGVSRPDAHSVKVIVTKILASRGILGGHAYLKELCGCLKSYLYSADYEPSVWVRRDADGFPSTLRFLRKYPIEVLAIATAMHKAIVYPEVTPQQKRKFLGSLTVDNVSSVAIEAAHVITNRGRLRLGVIGSGDLSFPTESAFLKAYRLYGKDSEDWLKSVYAQIMGQYLKLPRQLRWMAREALYPFKEPSIHNPSVLPIDDVYTVGRIGVTQEPGGKLRSYANPGILYQSMLDPLKEYVTRLLRLTEGDYTENHFDGARMVQSALLSGKTVYSLDSEDATNRAPWLCQRALLEKLNVPSNWIRLMDYLVGGEWDASSLSAGNVTWEHGQPLGIGPSFALYALWHNCFVAGLAESLGIHEICWAIIGDDLAIWNDELAKLYKIGRAHV